MTKKRPFGVTLLAILAGIAGVIAIIHTLQMLHLFPIRGPFGQFAFYTFDFLGALLWGVLALIYIWITRMLWNLDPQGWLFVAALATLNLILAVISILGQSTWQAMLPSILVNGLILIYTLLPGTKDAFGIAAAETREAVPAVVDEPTQAEAAMPEEPMVEEQAAATAEPETSEAKTEDETQVTGAAALSTDLAYVEGIGEVYSGQLKEAGVNSPQTLLERGGTPQGRNELAEATGISSKLILEWVNHVDLFRIKGVGSEYADLLEEAGVDTVVELAQRNPANLYAKLGEVNAAKELVRKLPTAAEVEDWVSQAKDLPRMISY
jgi:predicted flap endonuclease-1-like 5' DNA nuclease